MHLCLSWGKNVTVLSKWSSQPSGQLGQASQGGKALTKAAVRFLSLFLSV